jgi:hypothetical protein
MYNAFLNFKKNLEESKALAVLYSYLSENVGGPVSYHDLLRAQVVYSVSAFDKLMHDMILLGLVDIYKGDRLPTEKYLGEALTMNTVNKMAESTLSLLPPPEFHFKEAMLTKLKLVSYQDPSKIADGLAYIWRESHKWVKVANAINMSDSDVKVQLRLIADRRNAIVHEADINPATLQKNSIDVAMANEVSDFLEKCAEAIYNLVK